MIGSPPGDFGGRCLIGPCAADGQLMLRGHEVLGVPKSTSYLLCTFRDAEGTLLRCLRALGTAQPSAAVILTTIEGGHLQQDSEASASLACEWSDIACAGDAVCFQAGTNRGKDVALSEFMHRADGVSSWSERGVFAVEGRLLGPGFQWYHPWPSGTGGCYAAAFYYRADGTFLGRDVSGFFVHEIHYLPSGMTWMESPYATDGVEVIWQHGATQYDDGSTTYGSFACGADGWGFAMLFREDGSFTGVTGLKPEVRINQSGYPASVIYDVAGERWHWTIDPHGERGPLRLPQLVGAEGTWQRVADKRGIAAALGNSDWWTDGRGDSLVVA